MGTRLLSEAMIRKQYPHLRYVRIHTTGKNAADIYAWSDNLELTEEDRALLKRFAAGYFSPYVCYQVKAYSMLQADGVSQAAELPDPVIKAAMNRGLSQFGIMALINGMISGGDMAFDRYDGETGTIYFNLRTESPAAIADIEKELIRQYLREVIPVGSRFEVRFL